MVMREDGSIEECRVANIEAPEVKHPKQGTPEQPYGDKATDILKGMLGDSPFDALIKSPPKGKMSNGEEINYGRKLCLLAKDGKSINMELVRQGAAWASKWYGGRADYIEAQAKAEAEHLGLWFKANPDDPDPLYPEDFRKKHPFKNR